jgi:hypothetical protein
MPINRLSSASERPDVCRPGRQGIGGQRQSVVSFSFISESNLP